MDVHTEMLVFSQDCDGLTEAFAPGRPLGYPRGRPWDIPKGRPNHDHDDF